MENQISLYVIYAMLFLQLATCVTTATVPTSERSISNQEYVYNPDYKLMNHRTKKWYSWNDIDVSKKWYDWQEMPQADKRTFIKRKAADNYNDLDIYPQRYEWRFTRL